MAHLKNHAHRADTITPPEWLRVGAQIGALVNEYSDRNDIVAYVGPGAGGPAPASFSPASAEVEVNVDIAFGPGVKPDHVNLNSRSGRYEFPKAVGALAHEAFHAKFSQWDMLDAYKVLDKAEYAALILLEETRIEAQGVSHRPKLRAFVKACAMDIVLADAQEGFENMSTTQGATELVGLVHARIDAGVLNIRDMRGLTDLIEDTLGLDIVARLRVIAQKFQAHTDHASSIDLQRLAKEWVAVVDEACEKNGDAKPERGEGGEGAPGEGGEGAPGEMPEGMKALMDALQDAAEAAGINAGKDLEDAERNEKYEDVRNERTERAREERENKAEAKKCFGKGTGVMSAKTSSSLKKERPPTTEERISAHQVATLLEKAKYRERDIVEVRTNIPGGRLNARALVQGAALKEKGVRTPAQPWRKKVRKSTDEPTLSVGVLVDISGSMCSAMEPMATTAYVMAEATYRAQGNCAMVYFGNDTFATLKPGERRDSVKVFSAEDETEKFDKAFKAVDGAVNLLHGTGARLLVVVSDGRYTVNEFELAREWIARCKQEGVAVVWLGFSHDTSPERILNGYGKLVPGRLDPTKAAILIGKACAEQLTAVGQRNG